MKMKPEDFAKLCEVIQRIASPERYAAYQHHGLSNKRYNWDLLWASKFDVSPMYSYLNDDHINTALVKITGKK